MKKAITFLALLSISFVCHAQLNAEQASIKKVFLDFLSFYKKNETKFNSFQLYKGKGKENGPPYKIQWKEAEKYFTYLRQSVPFVSEAYINTERKNFKYYDSCFKADPIEEMPIGFDYDRWAGGQESIEYTYKWYSSPKNKYAVIITGNKAILKIGAELMWEGAKENDRIWNVVPFVKEKGKWKMADNIYPAEEGN